jgi:hypothetical protein
VLDRLRALVGEWTVRAAFTDGPPTGAPGRTTFEWGLDGRFLLQRSQAPPPAPDSLAVIAPDPNGETCTQHYFDSRGVVRIYKMSFHDDVWTLLRDAPDFTPLNFSQRFVGQLAAGGQTIDGAWETSIDGVGWKRDFGLLYTKIA